MGSTGSDVYFPVGLKAERITDPRDGTKYVRILVWVSGLTFIPL